MIQQDCRSSKLETCVSLLIVIHPYEIFVIKCKCTNTSSMACTFSVGSLVHQFKACLFANLSLDIGHTTPDQLIGVLSFPNSVIARIAPFFVEIVLKTCSVFVN